MRRGLAGAIAFAAFAAPAFAQEAPIIIDAGRLDRVEPEAPAPIELRGRDGARVEIAPAPREEAQTAPLASVALQGGGLIPAAVEEIWRPFVGRPLDAALAGEIAEAIAALYRQTDVALYSVIAPQQDLSDGALELVAIEGALADVAIETDDPQADDIALVQAYVAHLPTQRPLSRASMERAFALIRALPGVRLAANLVQTDQPGLARLVLRVEHDRVRVGAAINNRGTPRLGRTQVSADLAWNGVALAGDQATIFAAAPTDFESFFFIAAAYSAPIGEDGVRVRVSASRLETQPDGLRGTAETYGALVSYPLIASNARSLTISGAFDWAESENATLGQITDTSRTRVLRAALAYGQIRGRLTLNAGATLSLGLDAFDAYVDPILADVDFTRLSLTAGAERVLFGDLRLRARFAAQLTDSLLPGGEMFTLGGDAFGRAYPSALIAGDSGFAAMGELAFVPRGMPDWARGSEAYLFIDGGQIWRAARGLSPELVTGLASWGGGLRLGLFDQTIIGLEAAGGLDSPHGEEIEDWRILLAARSRWSE
ncbi:MAG: ShlB/FhaC/HecB family hemolysin secretion/activation protein [Hyphomonadaceae bacterium]